jgi:NitT/TauT family transport system substrate-binding protein
MWKKVCLSLVLATTVAAPLAAQPIDTKPATVRFGYITGLAFPTFIVAEERGYFKKENLTVEKTFLSGATVVSEALAAGNLDLGNSSPMSSILTTVKGGKTVMVSGYEATFTDKSGKPWEGVYIIARAGEGIKSLKDLVGKRIAVNDIGSTYDYFVRANYLEMGINPGKDVTIIGMPFGQMAGALVSKQVDAAVSGADGYALAKSRVPVDVIGNQTSLEKRDIGLTSVIGVNNDYLRQHPDVVVRFIRAFLQARLWMNEMAAKNDPALLETISKAMKYTPERAEFFWNTRGGWYGKDLAFMNLLDVPKRLVDRQVEVLQAVNVIKPDPVAYDRVVDIGPLRRAYESLGLKWDDGKH